MWKFITISLALLALIVASGNSRERSDQACAWPCSVPSSKIVQAKPVNRELRKVQMLDLYRSSLRDPRSAEFRNVQLLPGGAITGYVNAKNGFGGMSGWQKFQFGL